MNTFFVIQYTNQIQNKNIYYLIFIYKYVFIDWKSCESNDQWFVCNEWIESIEKFIWNEMIFYK